MPRLFYVDDVNSGSHRYDPSRFVEVSEGVRDSMTSWVLSRIGTLPRAGSYRINIPSRPDIYSRDIYGTTDHWQLLLAYNDVVLVEDLRVGRILTHFSLDALEGLYRPLPLQRAT